MKTLTRIKGAPGLLIGFALITQATLTIAGDKPDKLFRDGSEWKVTLSGPWRTIQRNSAKDARYPAQLTYPDADGQQITVDIEVAPRALTRRRICDFPPLKVFFDKKKMKGTELRGNKSLKLVTYCDLNRKFEQYYIKEFLIYRIYNLITDYSFRVKPLMVDYQKSGSSSNPVTRFSFLIEDADEVADRNDLQKLTVAKVPPSELHSVETSYFSLFQYMIGNLDFAATGGPDKNKCCHNAKIIGKGENEFPKYVIPYDFDSTGLVNSHYAAPPDKLKVRNVRQRLYRGFCVQNHTLAKAVDAFQQKKSAIMTLFDDNAHLNSSSKKRAISYIEDFYEVLDDPARFKREITDKCRG